LQFLFQEIRKGGKRSRHEGKIDEKRKYFLGINGIK
jgi:hypothetical protein